MTKAERKLLALTAKTTVLIYEAVLIGSYPQNIYEKNKDYINEIRGCINSLEKELEEEHLELLEALIESVETIEADIEECRDFRKGFGKNGCEECKRYKECDRWTQIRKARSVIAKAKGGRQEKE